MAKEFLATERRYRRGHMGLAYEIVINANPCISYLMEENSTAMQALVIAHAAYGHNSFFKNNYLFRMWSDAGSIIDYLVYARDYVSQCEERYGLDTVEQLLDSCHALANFGVDRYCRPSHKSLSRERAEREEREAYAAAGQRAVAHPACPKGQGQGQYGAGQRALPASPKRTSCISSRKTLPCSSPGSARSCASCARSPSISTRSVRPR